MSKPFERATRRPDGFVKPEHWTNDPAPQPAEPEMAEAGDAPDPTRFGDWTLNGIAVDF